MVQPIPACFSGARPPDMGNQPLDRVSELAVEPDLPAFGWVWGLCLSSSFLWQKGKVEDFGGKCGLGQGT